MTSACVDTIYITKLEKFSFLNVIYTTMTKEEMINILPIYIEIFFQKDIKSIIFLQYLISTLQLGDFNYGYKKITKCTDMFFIRCNF